MLKRLTILMLLLTLLINIPAQEINKYQLIESITDEITKEQFGKDTPGFLLGVVENGEFIFLKGYGLADIESKNIIDKDTQFDIGSVSKQFTAFCIALLHHEGKISLDDDIRKYVPEIPDYGKTITIRHLIHHTSGLRDYPNLMLLAGMSLRDSYQIKDILNLMARQKTLNFNPGDEYNYCNTGYFLLGLIVKRITGKSLGEFAKERIFNPLEMKNTVWLMDDNDPLPMNRAAGYTKINNSFEKVEDIFRVYDGAGGIQTTAEDMSKWMNNYSQKKLGDDELYKLIETRGVLNNGDQIAYSFGLINDLYKGKKRISHDGFSGSFVSRCEIYPELNLELIYLGNSNIDISRNLFQTILEKLYPDEIKTLSESGDNNLSLYDKFVGLYEMQGGFRIEISINNNKLYSKGGGQPAFELFASTDTSFFLKEIDATIDFHLEENRSVNIFTLHQNGHNISFHRVEETKPVRNEISKFMESYDGVYGINDGFRITIRHEENKLFAQGTGQPEFELTASSDTSFFLNVVDALIDFHVNENGSTNSFTLHQSGRDIVFNRIGENHKITDEDYTGLQGEYFSEELQVIYRIVPKDDKLILEAPDFGDIVPIPATAPLEYIDKDRYSVPSREIRVLRNNNHQITGFYIDFGRATNIEFTKK